MVLLLALLWALAGAYYLGDIGKTRDDYTWAVNDVVTGDVAAADLWRLPLFWRPLALILVRHLVSLTWEVPWVANLLAALAHLGLAAAMWRFLLPRVGDAMAGATAIVFLTAPVSYDVAHWPAASPTALAGLCLLAGAALATGWPSGRIRGSLAIAGLTFAACCFNEQAAACMGALPLLTLYTRRGAARRFVVATVAVALPSAIYIALLTLTAPDNHRGGVGTFLAPGAWLAHAREALAGLWLQTLGTPGRQLLLGGLEVGAVSMTPVGWLILVAAAVVGAVWVGITAPDRPASPSPAPRGLLVPAGVGWAMLGMMPFAIVATGPIEARHVYLPLLGLLLAVADAGSLLLTLLPRASARLAWRAIGGFAVMAACLGALSLVGVQTTLRTRYLLDVREAEAIQAVLPSPATGAIILVARAAWREADTGYPHYDKRFWSAWQMDHIATAVLRHQYRRDDIFAKHRFSVAFGLARSDVSPEGWTTGLSRGPAWDRGRIPAARIPWARLLAVTIDAKGVVRVVNRLRLTTPDRQWVQPLMQTERAVAPSAQRTEFTVWLR